MYQRAVDFIRDRVSSVAPRVGIVLGSGLGALVDAIQIAGAISYGEIPGFPPSTVEGHAGRLVLGHLAGVPVAVMQGRVHLYEGYAAREVVFPTRVLVRLGATRLVITNAAGCLNTAFKAREIMMLSDHLNLQGTSALLGKNDDALGPRFPDMTEAYDPEYRRIAREVAEATGVTLREGVYAGLLGPQYETPAEIRMLKAIGADAVGMSTVNEVIAARHMGARVLGLSALSNMAAGISAVPLSHAEVKEAADAMQADLTALISGVVARIGA
ncbi:purine-nucleoside phosphorylase [Myxococcota bacterium]|nr:purine-nucleoside phosphorylase [Myxococcota bacterium]